MVKVTRRAQSSCRKVYRATLIIQNKTPSQALTPPAEKTGKTLTYVLCNYSGRVNMGKHEKYNYYILFYFRNIYYNLVNHKTIYLL